MHAPGAAELLDGQRLIAGVEQQRVDVPRGGARFVDRRRVDDVNDLHEPDAGERTAQLRVAAA